MVYVSRSMLLHSVPNIEKRDCYGVAGCADIHQDVPGTGPRHRAAAGAGLNAVHLACPVLLRLPQAAGHQEDLPLAREGGPGRGPLRVLVVRGLRVLSQEILGRMWPDRFVLLGPGVQHCPMAAEGPDDANLHRWKEEGMPAFLGGGWQRTPLHKELQVVEALLRRQAEV